MKVCLDTNAYSALMRGEQRVKEKLEAAEVIILPAVVLGELHAGFSAGTRVHENEAILQQFLQTPGTRIKEIDRDTARRYGQIVQQLRTRGKPIPTNDIWIAAVAFETGSVLLTADRHFSVVPMLETTGWDN